MDKVVIVTPTIRYNSSYQHFKKAWKELFSQHEVTLLTVIDGEQPRLMMESYHQDGEVIALELDTDFLGDEADLIYNLSPSVRNLGFAAAATLREVEMIMTLDDDLEPVGDPIMAHYLQLERRVSSHYWNTFADESIRQGHYPRGFPANERSAQEVVFSHGVWWGVADWDGAFQWTLGEDQEVSFYEGVVPYGCEFSICEMNYAFRPKVLPFVYSAPTALIQGAERFDDIWMGRHLKTEIDERNWALVTGYAPVLHKRASNVFNNIRHEIVGMEMNETYWERQHEAWFEEYSHKRQRWKAWIQDQQQRGSR